MALNAGILHTVNGPMLMPSLPQLETKLAKYEIGSALLEIGPSLDQYNMEKDGKQFGHYSPGYTIQTNVHNPRALNRGHVKHILKALKRESHQHLKVRWISG